MHTFKAYKLSELEEMTGKTAKNAAKQKENLFFPIIIGKNGEKQKKRYLDPFLSSVIRYIGYDGQKPETGLVFCENCRSFAPYEDEKKCHECKSTKIVVLFVPGSRTYERKHKTAAK